MLPFFKSIQKISPIILLCLILTNTSFAKTIAPNNLAAQDTTPSNIAAINPKTIPTEASKNKPAYATSTPQNTVNNNIPNEAKIIKSLQRIVKYMEYSPVFETKYFSPTLSINKIIDQTPNKNLNTEKLNQTLRNYIVNNTSLKMLPTPSQDPVFIAKITITSIPESFNKKNIKMPMDAILYVQEFMINPKD